jgi:hypothetical protein
MSINRPTVSQHLDNPLADDALQPNPRAPGADLVPRPDDLFLIETPDDGTVLVFGEGDIGGLDLRPLSLMSVEDRHALSEAIAQTVGTANVAVQTLHGINQLRGLVRLAPETIQALSSGATPIVKEGWNLGTLVTQGKIARQVRWLPVGSAGAVGVLATIGPAAALVAIQWQLTEISRMVEQNIALTNQVLKAIRTEQWAKVQAHHDSVLDELRHAQAIGAVTPDIWNHVQAQSSETALRGDRRLFFEQVQGHMQSLSRQTGAQSHRDWLSKNAEPVLRDIDALLMADRAWFVYQALRAAHLTGQARVSKKAAQLQSRIVEEARAAHAEAHAAMAPLLGGLYRQFRLMEECPGGMGLTLKGRKQTPSQVAEAARSLADQIGRLPGMDTFDPNEVEPVLNIGWDDAAKPRTDIARRLRWILGTDETLLAMAYGSTSEWLLLSGYVVFTNRRIRFLKEAAFLKEGQVDREILLSTVNAVGYPEKSSPLRGPNVVVIADIVYHIELTEAVSFEEVDPLVEALRASTRKSGGGDRHPEALKSDPRQSR